MDKKYEFLPYTQTSKTDCPSCGHKKCFTKMINTETSEVLPSIYGMCDRFKKCGYKRFPTEDEEIEQTGITATPKEKKNYFSILNQTVLNETLTERNEDNFSKWIISTFGEKVKKTLNEYYIGCQGKYKNTVFWQIDEENRIRSGKLINYDVKTGKRNKDFTTWMHSLLKIEDYVLLQCFFGEHLLKKYPDKKICVVEGEKNAIVCSILYPQYLWLAAGQLHGLSDHKLNVLKGKTVIFYPDKGFSQTWKNRLEKARPSFNYQISEVLERRTDLEEGSDLVDMYLKDKKNLVV